MAKRGLGFLWLTVAMVDMYACGGGRGKDPVTAGGLDGCKIAAGSSAPLVVEWDGAARGKLEALRSKHLIAVRRSGCELEILPACTVKAEYAYVPLTPKRDRVVVRDEQELYANLPLHAVSLSAKLKSAGQLNVDMTMVGRFEARAAVGSDQLEGDCSGATHVITGLTTGAFEFYAGSATHSGGGVEVANVGAGEHSKTSVDVLNHDGEPRACSGAKPGDTTPPFKCGAVIRIELTELGARSATPSCASPLIWNGRQCTSTSPGPPATAPSCTPGAPLDRGGCPPGPAACPKGTHHEGAGCAPDAMAKGATIRVPGGTYRWQGGKPVLTVATFDLDVTEVTLAQYKACVDAGKCVPPTSNEQRCNWGKDGRARHPMNCVTWDEAKTYCDWAGKRLPTDIEWDYATVGQTGWKYPWGNEVPEAKHLCRVNDGNLNTCPVGTFPAGQSRFGILDMAGNVNEWVLDAFCTSFDANCYSCGCRGYERSVHSGVPASAREGASPGHTSSAIGFRCAASVAPSPGPRSCPTGTLFALDVCVAEKGPCPPGLHSQGIACVPDGSP